MRKIAVIGGGISGIATAFLLDQHYEVTLFEKNSRLGGHTNTVTISDGADKGTAIDTGFIVFNDVTYPLFKRFLQRLNVSVQQSTMSFSCTSRHDGFCYSSDFLGLFGANGNLFRPAIWRLVGAIIAFNHRAKKSLAQGVQDTMTLGEYIKELPSYVAEQYLFPMASAIWSVPQEKVREFPIKAFLNFFSNHGLLDIVHKIQWNTIAGGSGEYIKKFQQTFSGTIKTDCPVTRITRDDTGVTVYSNKADIQHFNAVILATHADQTLALLEDADTAEKDFLQPWAYSRNHILLHTDPSFMPPTRKAWACWNYAKGDGIEKNDMVTYYMNRLQKLNTQRDYFVTLNCTHRPAEKNIMYETTYEHPQYSFESLAVQKKLSALNGRRNTFFCGSYTGYGFHEDGIRSAVTAAQKLGVSF